MVLLHTPPGELGSPAADFALPGVSGSIHTLADYQQAPAMVVVFWCNHCPYVQALEQRVIDLAKEMNTLGVRFIAVSSNDTKSYPEDSFPNMKKRAKEKKYTFDYLFDEKQTMARAYGAVCTPDFFVYDQERKLRYRGRLDDSPRNPAGVRKQELKEAILAVLNGRPVPTPQNPSMGCSLKWLGEPKN
ncbi:MAG: thioredoxin family protein [Magnetococcales bacterium]|nr:thioredoxin family protein [Magnetococcales bacterium]